MKIYTKTGDGGTTALIGGARVAKSDLRIETYGTIDELNAQLGLLAAQLDGAADGALIEQIQTDLFVVGSHLATDPQKTEPARRYRLSDASVVRLEQEIDRMVASLPRQTAFLLPGGCLQAAQAPVCRPVCRRADRRMVELQQRQPIQPQVLQYINRLSDYLFVLSRRLNAAAGRAEKMWQ